MEVFVHIHSPFGTVSHIIDDAVVCNILTGTAVTIIVTQFHFCDGDFWNVHLWNYTGDCIKRKIREQLVFPDFVVFIPYQRLIT